MRARMLQKLAARLDQQRRGAGARGGKLEGEPWLETLMQRVAKGECARLVKLAMQLALCASAGPGLCVRECQKELSTAQTTPAGQYVNRGPEPVSQS